MSKGLTMTEKGSILAETLIALLLLSMTALPLYGVMTVAERLERRSERFAQMMMLAQQVLESKRAQIKADPTQCNSSLPQGLTISEGFRCDLTVRDAIEPAELHLKEVSVILWDQASFPQGEVSEGTGTMLPESPSLKAAGAKCALATLVALPAKGK
ncbi:hypothetical protein GTO91_01920 [Heliobacterium undosum]|uniref:Prepilin-type N-terminal cleavage/methylation domain-containing protein n=1 Tax=Heliomicrobium undosum TaxID=121734 RepID=A0A845L6E3_9FIRM|nr:hypothetical protein [Heliomicrobium undosum]MZP28481.1 hypothetical protein [Heliomicrobium undosum]